MFLPGGLLLRPQTEAIVGAAAVSSLQQYSFTKAFARGQQGGAGSRLHHPSLEEAAVEATVVHHREERLVSGG